MNRAELSTPIGVFGTSFARPHVVAGGGKRVERGEGRQVLLAAVFCFYKQHTLYSTFSISKAETVEMSKENRASALEVHVAWIGLI